MAGLRRREELCMAVLLDPEAHHQWEQQRAIPPSPRPPPSDEELVNMAARVGGLEAQVEALGEGEDTDALDQLAYDL